MTAEPYLTPGLLLADRYRVDMQLARGGFGEVYRAFDLRIERDVALKYVFYKLDLETLRNEVTILARNAERLKFIPNIYDHWQGRGEFSGYFIVMEYIEGATLDKHRPLPWPSDQVIAFLEILLRNLRDLHRSNIIHCDIKPINIKASPPSDLSYQVPYRILDFGIAKQGDETTIRASSPHYAAPEQYPLGEMRQKIDQRTDLYSLAATAYFLLTGKRPPGADLRYANIYEHRYGDPLTPPGRLVADVPWGLEQTLLDMLQIDRERRPISADEALLRLEQRLVAGAVEPDDATGHATAPTARTTIPPPSPLEHLPLVTELTDRPLSTAGGAPVGDFTPTALPPGEPLAATPSSPPVGAAPPVVATPAALPPLDAPSGPTATLPDGSLTQAKGGAVANTLGHGMPAPLPPGSLVELGRRGDGLITSLAWQPDSRSLIVGTSLGLYRLAAQGGGRELWQPTATPVRHIGYVLGGEGLLVASASVTVLREGSSTPPDTLAALSGVMLTAPQGETVAALDNATLRVFNLHTGTELAAWRLSERLQGQVVALSADGKTVVIGDGDRLWRHTVGGGQRGGQRAVNGLPQPLIDLTLTPDGNTIAIASPTTILIWSSDEEHAQTLIPEHRGVARVALANDGRTLAVATAEQVSLRRAADGKTLLRLEAPELAGVQQLAFSPDDRLLVAASNDELRLWSLRDGSLQRLEADWAERARALATLPDGSGLFALGPWLRHWSVAGAQLVTGASLAGPTGGPYTLAVSSDGARLAVAGADKLTVRSLHDGQERFAVGDGPVQSDGLAYSGDGARLCVVGLDTVTLLDAATGATLARRQLLDRRAIEHVALAGDLWAAVQSMGRVIVVNLADGSEHCTVVTRGASEITAIALSADGALLAVAHADTLALWRVSTDPAQQIDRRPLEPGPAIQRLTFDSAGERLMALRGLHVEVWVTDGDALKLSGVARGHTDRVVAAVPLREGLFATASLDGTLRVWSTGGAASPTPGA